MSAKICPLMSRPIPRVGEYKGQDVIEEHYVDCPKENCALWVYVWNTERGQEQGCALAMMTQTNSDGKIPV